MGHPRRSDTLAGLGGDEHNPDGILPLEQANCYHKIHQIVGQFQFHWENESFRIGVSIGLVISISNKGGSDIHLKQADMACFMAKQAGRNRTRGEDDKAWRDITVKKDWVVRIKPWKMIFCLYTQSSFRLAMKKVSIAGLIRMKDKNSLISPDTFAGCGTLSIIAADGLFVTS
jgi:predicted signal transduction protein with EAL and GGDEF domain